MTPHNPIRIFDILQEPPLVNIVQDVVVDSAERASEI